MRFFARVFGLLIPILIIASFHSDVFARNAGTDVVWTRTIIPTAASGCRIEITKGDISPDATRCRYSGHMRSGTKLSVRSQIREASWVKLTMSDESEQEFEIYIGNSSNSDFKYIFDQLFSRRAIKFEYPTCRIKTKWQTIRNVGFPSDLFREAGKEKWTFGADYVAFEFCNYDVTYIEFKDGKLVELTGLI